MVGWQNLGSGLLRGESHPNQGNQIISNAATSFLALAAVGRPVPEMAAGVEARPALVSGAG